MLLIDRKRSPSASRDPNQKYNQREERGDHSQYAPGVGGGMPRSPSDYGDGDPRRGGPRGSPMHPDADAARASYRGERGRWHSQEYPLEIGRAHV